MFWTWYVLSQDFPLEVVDGNLLKLFSSVMTAHFLELYLVKGGKVVITLLLSFLLFLASVVLNLLPCGWLCAPVTSVFRTLIFSTLLSVLFGGGVGASCNNSRGVNSLRLYSSAVMANMKGIKEYFACTLEDRNCSESFLSISWYFLIHTMLLESCSVINYNTHQPMHHIRNF